METGADGEVTGVRPDRVVLLGVRNGEDWCATQGLFEGLEGTSCCFGPEERLSGTSKISKRGSYVTEVADELPIEIAEAKETTNFTKGLRLRPCLNCLNLLKIYLNLSDGNNMS